MSVLSSLAGAPLLKGKRNKGVTGKSPGSNYTGDDTACVCSLSACCCHMLCAGLQSQRTDTVKPGLGSTSSSQVCDCSGTFDVYSLA